MNIAAKYVIYGIVLVMLVGVFHILFIAFDYGFNNPDTGAMTRIKEISNETLTGDYRDSANDNYAMLTQFFGIGRFAILVIGIIGFVVCVLAGRKEPEN